MKKVAALVILLVGLLASKAHDAHSSVFTEGWSTTQATTARSENSSKQNAVGNNSVVVNWSSICKDLCGAGFGGSVCGKHCYRSQPSPFQVSNGKYDSVNLCPVLCKFDLGGRKCECASKSSSRAPKNSKEFCYVVCKHYNISVDGCSECSPNESESSGTDLPSTSDATTSPVSDSESKESESVATTPAQPPSTPQTTTTPPPRTTTVRKTSKFTTISSTTPMDDTTWTSATTPDWHLLCKELCKKGEGGQLCNCDLPPLTLKSN